MISEPAATPALSAPKAGAQPESKSEHPLWACVSAGFYVGSRKGVFLGYVDRQPDGGFLAFDGRSRLLGAFAEQHLAMAAVSAGEHRMNRAGEA